VWREEKLRAYFWMGKPKGKTTRGRPRRRWKNNAKVDLKGKVSWRALD